MIKTDGCRPGPRLAQPEVGKIIRFLRDLQNYYL
jgi:hypothetical protein